MLALKKAIAAKRTGVTTSIDSPARESQCNGVLSKQCADGKGSSGH